MNVFQNLSRVVLSFVLLMGLLLAASCTNKEVYGAIQQNRQFECRKLPPTQYDACMEEYGQPYDEYLEEREQVINEDE